jgi:hypothetical protein
VQPFGLLGLLRSQTLGIGRALGDKSDGEALANGELTRLSNSVEMMNFDLKAIITTYQ